MHRLNTTSKALCVLLMAGSVAVAQNNNQGESQQNNKPSAQQNQGDLPSLDTVFEKAVESVGGKDKLGQIKSVHTVLTMSVMGRNITMENKWGRDGGRFSSNESPFGNSEMGSDGKVAWMKMPGDRYVLLDEQQADQLDSQASMHMNLLNPELMREDMEEMEVVAQEEFDGKAAYKVRFDPKESEGSGFMYFDVRNGRPLGMMQTEVTPMGQQTTTITLDDWKTIDGVQFFHLMKIESPAMPEGAVDMKITRLEVNKLGEDAFELPDKVKQLAANAENSEGESEEAGGEGSANAGDEIKLEDLPETYRERARSMVEQMKAGGKDVITQTLQQLEGMIDSVPEGDDKQTLRYVIQELKKAQ